MGFIASAFLSAYMAMTGMTADVPQRNAPDLAAQTVTAQSVASNASTSRRRAVRHPGNPAAPLDVQFMGVQADALTVTNYDTVPATIKACMTTCADYTVAPSQTLRADVRTLGTGPFSLKTNTTTIDATTDKGNLQRTSNFATNQILPTGDLTKFYQETLLLATQPGTATMTVRNDNGLVAYTQTMNYNPGMTTVPPFFGQQMSGRHMEVTSTTPIGAIARLTDSTSTLHVPSSTTPQTSTYVPNTSGTFAVIANTNAEATSASMSLHQENGNTFTGPNRTIPAQGSTFYQNAISDNNAFGTGMLHIRTTLPTHTFTSTPTLTINEAAIGRTGLSNDETTPYSVWFQNGNRIDLAEVSNYPGTVTGSINAYNGTTTVGKKDFTIPPDGTASVDVSNLAGERYEVRVNRGPQGSNFAPRLITTSTDGKTTWKGYRTVAPAPKVTGEEYVAKWLDTLKTQYFYLSNNEVRCMINGNCGTRSYAPDMANVLGPGTGNPAGDIETSLRRWTDGKYESGNQELIPTFDPLNTSMVNDAVGFYFMPDGSRISKFTMPTPSMTSWYGVVRSFLAEYTQTHPEQYGGTTSTGPNLDFNPTWSSQDKN